MHYLSKILSGAWCEAKKLALKMRFPYKAKLGNGTYFRKGFFLNPTGAHARISIGRRCFFNNYCSINCHESITIGDGCTFGEGVRIYDHDHDFRGLKQKGEAPYITAPVTIGDGVWCGSNVLILKGVSIGSHAVVGAGTVVVHDVPPDTLIYAKQNLELRPIEKAR